MLAAPTEICKKEDGVRNPKMHYIAPPSARQVAFHEAGHLVVAWVEGFEIDGLRMNINMSGAAETRPARLAPDPEEYIRKRVHVLLAGTIIQHLATAKDFKPNNEIVAAIKESLEFGNGVGDWAKAMELVWLLRNMKATSNDDPVGEVNVLLQQLMNETGEILERNLLPIQRLGNIALRIFNKIDPNDFMEARDEFYLPAEDVMALIKGTPGSHEIAEKHIAAHRMVK